MPLSSMLKTILRLCTIAAPLVAAVDPHIYAVADAEQHSALAVYYAHACTHFFYVWEYATNTHIAIQTIEDSDNRGRQPKMHGYKPSTFAL